MIKWGIIGAGNIAKRFAKSLQYEKDAALYAISGRNEQKLIAFKQAYPCEKIYIGHDKLLEDENVDAVYIALPHNMHAEWSVKALKAHKAVLCEKPAVMNAQEMCDIQAVSKHEKVLFMEAMKPRFVPAYQKIKELIEKGEIGTITSVKAENCFLLSKDLYGKTYHTKPGVGGALLDSGCYGVNWLNAYLKGTPSVLDCHVDVMNGVDMYSDTKLQFDNGIGELITGFDRNTGSHLVIYGTKGSIRCDNMHRPTEVHLMKNGSEETHFYPYVYDDFYGEIHAFDELFKAGKTESPVMTLSDSVRNAEIMDIIRNAFKKGK